MSLVWFTPSDPKKVNLKLYVTYPSTTNLDRSIFKFVVLGYVTSITMLIFLWNGEYFESRMCLLSEYNVPEDF